KPPVMRRWTRSTWPLWRRTTMYLPRRSTDAIRSPVSIPATMAGSSGRVRRTSSMRADAIRFPAAAAASRPRSVSTSGSSGTDDAENDRDLAWRAVADLVRGEHRGRALVPGGLRARVDLGERLPLFHRVAALLAADDADRVVDGLPLRPAGDAPIEPGYAGRVGVEPV